MAHLVLMIFHTGKGMPTARRLLGDANIGSCLGSCIDRQLDTQTAWTESKDRSVRNPPVGLERPMGTLRDLRFSRHW